MATFTSVLLGPFVDENLAQGLIPGTAAPVQIGRSDPDPGTNIEQGITLPWCINPVTSWLDYRCRLEVELDAGMALHKPLPQSNPDPDTLAVIAMDDPSLDQFTGPGVSLDAGARAVDVVQRMATSTYRFILKGYGLRVGYQVPVPGLVSVAGADAIPAERQWTSGNVLLGNYSGIPLWGCQWELHYYVAEMFSPGQADAGAPIPPNPALHIRPDVQLPLSVQVPYSQPDQDAVPAILRTQTP